MPTTHDAMRLARAFMPYFARKRDHGERHNVRLAYYTHCETANSLIRNQEFWLRDYRFMNDSGEVKHGVKLIRQYFSDPEKAKRFSRVLDDIVPGAFAKGWAMYQEWITVRKPETFLMSFIRHAPPDYEFHEYENSHGKLSMWRGYGRGQGTAITFNVPYGQTSNGQLIFFLSPVAYLEQIDAYAEEVMAHIAAEQSFIKSMPADWVERTVLVMLVAAATSIKHPGFHEEDEWRLLYLPSLWRSSLVRHEDTFVKGKMQQVCKIPFDAFTKAGITGMEPAKLFDRAIVGPSKFQPDIQRYIRDALRSVGSAAEVIVSGTPFVEDT